MTQAYYRKTPQQALEAQNASAEGLSAQEARRRAEQYGPNKLSEGKKKSTLQVFWSSSRISWYSYSLSQR